jgi:rhamnogalacturonyl hydrolase YesR
MAESTLQRYTLNGLAGITTRAAGYGDPKAGEATGEVRYKRFVSEWIDHFVQADGNIRTYRVDEHASIRSTRKLLLNPTNAPEMNVIARP